MELGRLHLGTSAAAAAARRGFTFIEVMFAVMILGFGVIMIAAMLPVAVRQTQNTRETNAGSAIIESGFHQTETIWGGYDALARGSTFAGGSLPATNRNNTTTLQDFVVTFPSWGWADAFSDGVTPDTDGDGINDALETQAGTDPNDNTVFPVIGLHTQTAGSRIESTGARDAWIPFYTRFGSLPPSQALVGVRVRNVDAFVQGHFTNLDNAPLPVSFQLDPAYYTAAGGFLAANSRGGADHIEPTVIELQVPSTLSAASPTEPQIAEAAVEGAVIVVVNGSGMIRILTLGKPVADDATGLQWTLAPGGDVGVVQNPLGPDPFSGEFPAGQEIRGYLLGRMLRNPSAPWSSADNPYVGPTQVIQVLEGKMLP